MLGGGSGDYAFAEDRGPVSKRPASKEDKKRSKSPTKGKAAKGKGAKGKEAAAEPVPEKPAVWGQVANAVVYGVPSTFKLS